MSGVVTGLLGAVVAVVLLTVAERKQKPARENGDGWKTLRASWLHIAMIICFTGMASLAGYVILTEDWNDERAIDIILVIIIATGSPLAVFYIAWVSYGRTVMWKEKELRVLTIFGGETAHKFAEVCSMRRSETLGEYQITFRDGSEIRFDAHMHGANELVYQMYTAACEE